MSFVSDKEAVAHFIIYLEFYFVSLFLYSLMDLVDRRSMTTSCGVVGGRGADFGLGLLLTTILTP